MAQVDPDDDAIDRWVVFRYRFDPALRHRRHVIIAAFDNEAEFLAAADAEGCLVRDEIAHGFADAREHVTGMRYRPGHHERQRQLCAERKMRRNR